MLTVRSLGSGSSGNAFLIEAGGVVLALDCGVGVRALLAGLRNVGRPPAELDALLLSHEHADHVRSLPQLLRYGVPVVSTAGTARATQLPSTSWSEIKPGRSRPIGGVVVTALSVSHDAAEPCGFHLATGDGSVVIVTDLGYPDTGLDEYLAGADLIVLEANHDEAMLRSGPYPLSLKRRVLSRHGHLSNHDCADLLSRSLDPRGRHQVVWLAHLSATNNRPGLARDTVERALLARDLATPVIPLPRYGTQVWRLGQQPAFAIQMALPLL